MTGLHRIGYIGNFRPAHSTENHVAAALRSHGHTVVEYQEHSPDGTLAQNWAGLADRMVDDGCDFTLWTRTWHIPEAPQRVFLDRARALGLPTVGFHLDRWWGLNREHQVIDEPFFGCDVMVTADGGHDEQWAAAGIRHWWMPPGVLGSDTHDVIDPASRLGPINPVLFMGSWESYHPEWAYRMQLVQWLRAQYERSGRLSLLPMPGNPSVRGPLLNGVYRAARVIIGDSCLAGSPARYWSDRLPETLGRGGFLIHPSVDGLDEHFTPDKHLVTYDIGDLPTLRNVIDFYLNEPAEAAQIAAAGRAHVLEHHTYEVRMAQLIQRLHDEGVVPNPDQASGLRTVVDRHGLRARFRLRAGTQDACVVNEVWRENTYGLAPVDVVGRPVVDVGANIGAFTVWAAMAGASGVWAYEPDVESRVALHGHVRAAIEAITSVVVIDERAVTGDGRETRFRADGASGGIVPADADGEWIDSIAIDDVLRQAGRGVVLKLDCEGGEYDIVDALTAWPFVDVIVMEFHGPGMLPADVPVDPIEDFGRMAAQLAEQGHVRILGRPSVGGLLTWRRY